MNTDLKREIVPIAIPGIHENFYRVFTSVAAEYKHPEILEVGSGHGAFTRKLWDAGFSVSACDFFPENFYFTEVECRKVDITRELPYADDSFDIIIAVEVMEHIHDHAVFFRECKRILKPKGMLMISSPNILSLKSRIRFLFSGFFYSYQPLDHKRTDGLQHISSMTIDQYENLALVSNYASMEVFFDKKQRTSKIYTFLIPFMWIYCRVKKIDYRVHNNISYLTGRIMILVFRTG